MKIIVKLFAVAKEIARADTIALELPEHATVADVRRSVAEQLPKLEPLLASMMVTVGEDYASDATVVSEGADIALIPPVSGG
jgi:molybdopterin converting factor subunit 1